jgi:hypothetical protein
MAWHVVKIGKRRDKYRVLLGKLSERTTWKN